MTNLKSNIKFFGKGDKTIAIYIPDERFGRIQIKNNKYCPTDEYVEISTLELLKIADFINKSLGRDEESNDDKYSEIMDITHKLADFLLMYNLHKASECLWDEKILNDAKSAWSKFLEIVCLGQ